MLQEQGIKCQRLYDNI